MWQPDTIFMDDKAAEWVGARAGVCTSERDRGGVQAAAPKPRLCPGRSTGRVSSRSYLTHGTSSFSSHVPFNGLSDFYMCSLYYLLPLAYMSLPHTNTALQNSDFQPFFVSGHTYTKDMLGALSAHLIKQERGIIGFIHAGWILSCWLLPFFTWQSEGKEVRAPFRKESGAAYFRNSGGAR